jgi:hypothetical protein
MKLSLTDINEDDSGLLGPCGIICAGCDWHTDESSDAAKTVIQIWEGHNLADVAILNGLNSQDIMATIKTLKNMLKLARAPGVLERRAVLFVLLEGA